MKNFKKVDNLFICEECGFKTTRLTSLSRHIKHQHNYKIYFDQWIKDENDDKCFICGEKTTFVNFSDGYKKYCCRECEYINRNNTLRILFKNDKDIVSKRTKTFIERWCR
jgi:late competence protein required for DNA uptake (superfamily II DNA/RNA helicase)